MSRFLRPVRETCLLAVMAAAVLVSAVRLAGCSEQPTPTAAPPSDGFSTSPGQLTLTAVGDTARITAMATPVGGTEPVAVGGVAWSSSDTTVATVSGDGLVTAWSNGMTMISGSSGIQSDRTVVVVSQTPARVEIQPSTLTLSALGASAHLTAHAFDRTSHEIPSTDIRWSSTDTSVVTVSSDGTITARRNGAAQILATVVGWPQSTRRIPAPGTGGRP